ncbi:hypothetical protein [Leifsonia soli]|uniref:Antibiotic biosynthesis monooxygenase (ABM) superfamily enzyme n=1 Tax=Leifsonia soli TaxID=582665 RepID=A0A852SW86_9MICO|nr:hypothetical protein [Leifsonia soli]NYD72800.1 antibiotic biosynthesis monooxygenase (ABM) superfamily enzyme [Leifsonia soli]
MIRWINVVAPMWTFILGLLIGVLPGGVTNPANVLAIGLYLCTLLLLVPLGMFARWLERQEDDESKRS